MPENQREHKQPTLGNDQIGPEESEWVYQNLAQRAQTRDAWRTQEFQSKPEYHGPLQLIWHVKDITIVHGHYSKEHDTYQDNACSCPG